MAAAEMDQIADETAKVLIFRSDVFPIGPRDLIVLAIGVVVPALCSPDLVTGQQHRNAQRQKQRGKQIAPLAIAQADYGRVRGRSLDPAIPAEVGIASVAIILAIGLIVLFIVADQVLQCETIMRGNKIYARPGTPAAVAEDVGRARHARGEIGDETLVTLPKAPHCVAVLPIPLRPARRKIAQLVAVRTEIPRLGNQL